MEDNNNMTNKNLEAILIAIREAAAEHGESHTVELINKILTETK